MTETIEAVRQRYAELAQKIEMVGAASCCDPADSGGSCCGSYDTADLQSVGLSEGISLGCGNPTMLADLHPGEVVLDLGSGGGLDVLLSARRVAPGGHAYGVDMTDEMLALAEGNRAKASVDNATFLKGTIENVPLPAESVDVVISNCVVNLAEDKGAVLRESHRLLRSGGRLAIADMVEVEQLAPKIKSALDKWAGCIAGTIPVDRYQELLSAAGFSDISIDVHDIQEMPGQGGRIGSAYIRATKP